MSVRPVAVFVTGVHALGTAYVARRFAGVADARGCDATILKTRGNCWLQRQYFKKRVRSSSHFRPLSFRNAAEVIKILRNSPCRPIRIKSTPRA